MQGTCNEACWLAKEPVCRCQCGGVNHGIMLEMDPETGETKEQPGRYKQQLGVRYQLDSVHTTWSEANAQAHQLSREYNERWDLNWWVKSAFHESAKGGQLKWPEVKGLVEFWDRLGAQYHIYLVWVRLEPEKQYAGA